MGLFWLWYTIIQLKITLNVYSFAWQMWKVLPIVVEFPWYPKSRIVAWAHIKYLDFSPKGSDHGDRIRIVKCWLFVVKYWISWTFFFVIRKCSFCNFRQCLILSWTESKQLTSVEGAHSDWWRNSLKLVVNQIC